VVSIDAVKKILRQKLTYVVEVIVNYTSSSI